MITPELLQTLSQYNRWRNASLYGAADTLTAAERLADRGAFWGSIEATLNHILWGDRMWLWRFGAGDPPRNKTIEGMLTEGGDWDSLKVARQRQDAAIAAWAETIEQAQLDGSMTFFSVAVNQELTRNTGLLVMHMFNHQTHHRGQVHAMLTAAGAKPDDTDIPFMPGQ
ncbi:MAG: DinB family protein [Pseudomonadota bacterium]